MSTGADVIVVGAGIVGAACAWECASAGLRTLVLECGPIGGGATAAGMGHLVVMDDSEAQFALTAFSRSLWQALADDLPDGVEYDTCGTLWVAADEAEMTEVRRKHGFYVAHGVRTEILDAESLREAEPSLRPGLAGGLRVIDDAVIYPPAAACYLLGVAQAKGAEVRTATEVISFTSGPGVVLRDGTRIAAACVVNATGAWAPQFSPGLPVRKRKGHLAITDRYPGFVHHQLVELGYLKSAHTLTRHSVACNIQPRKTGQMLIGSSRQFEVDDDDVQAEVLSEMLARAQVYLPNIGALSVLRVWTGHRAATPDKLPLIGPDPQRDGHWLATGHEGLGITTSLATGRLLSRQLTGSAPEIPVEPYLPARLQQSAPRHE